MTTPMFRFDPVELPPEALAMRLEVRDFIRENQALMQFPAATTTVISPAPWAGAAGSA
jgi:hypothetical protein